MNINVDKRQTQAIEALQQLLNDSKIRPFLFRTRFERTMIKVQSLARTTGDVMLEGCAKDAIRKMRSIVDKSNCTADGVLTSFIVLKPDISNVIELLRKRTVSAT